MTCEEFATAGLDLGAAGEDRPFQLAARQHLRECPRCAALQENWLALREELRAMSTDTLDAETPSRVEMRLRQEFRTKHTTIKTRRAAVIAGWAFAAAAALLGAFTWVNWRMQKGAGEAHKQGAAVQNAAGQANSGQPLKSFVPGGPELGEVLLASSASGDFTLLPGSMPPSLEDATVVRVQMQRAGLSALGLTVNEEHAADWIQVDLLVGDDGLPQAVRLPQTTD